MSKTIQLTHGKVAVISDHQYERVSKLNWWAAWSGSRWYAQSKDGSQKNVYLHRWLLGVTDPKIKVDHRDGDSLNCQDENIRVYTSGQNNHNRGKSKNNTTGFKGVFRYTRREGYYYAQICINYVSKHLGTFSSVEEAAHTYDEAAKKYHGEFAVLNFPEAAR